MVACQRYLRLDRRTFSNLPSLFLAWGPFSSSECSLRACSSVSFMRCISTGWRQSSPRTRSLTEPITSIEAATVRRSLRFIFLPASSLGLGFPFPRDVAPDSGCTTSLRWMLLSTTDSLKKKATTFLSRLYFHNLREKNQKYPICCFHRTISLSLLFESNSMRHLVTSGATLPRDR